MIGKSARVLSAFLTSLVLFACGGDPGPTNASSIDGSVASPPTLAPTTVLGLGAATFTTVEEVLANAGELTGTQVELQGRLTRDLGSSIFIFDDGTGTIPASFVPTGTTPELNETINIVANVGTGLAGFPASLLVSSWEIPQPFSCDDIIEVRARFSDPGFVAGDVVGYFLSYRGAPPGEKTLEINWDDGIVDTLEVGEGTAREDGLFELEGVVGHEYVGIKGSEGKSVRATLRIEGRDGGCARVRDITVSQGSGPGFAAGGALRLSFNDPVPSGGFFSVSARVSNPTGVPFDAELLFQTPDMSSIRTLGPRCQKIKGGELVECKITSVPANGSDSEFVQYNVPVVMKPTEISGSVTLVTKQLSPVASYSTTVEP